MSHLGGFIEGGDPYTYMPDIWEDVLYRFVITSVLDVGSGPGHNLKWFADRGLRVLGVEGHPGACESAIVPIREHDYTQGPLVLNETFDLCVCTEFVEHVEQQYEENWFATIESSPLVLMCHAIPGQGGYHHVNCRTSQYWIARFAHHGYSLLEEPTARYQSTGDPNMYGRRTLMLFAKVK